ncbi:hypothetical protein ACF5W4_04280 [Bacillota bacterium Lsc_1132]
MVITKIYRFRKAIAKKKKLLKPAMMLNRVALFYFLLGIIMLLLFVCGVKHMVVATLTYGFIFASLQIFIISAILYSTNKYIECGNN